ncbi:MULTISPECIES: hypothetical protein [unclassified Mameliella]|uniref:hypothetical protein n=1 Tax=Mameliella sp. LZ-28 TaxID=2484146 RepID=UPI00143F8B3B|nr:hypothetical protein [Mameliella sp. LZ-28]
MPSDDPWLDLDLLRERAAIIQEGEGCTRFLAESIAARANGYRDWVHAESNIRRRISEKKRAGGKVDQGQDPA